MSSYFEKLIEDAIKEKASDIHLFENQKPEMVKNQVFCSYGQTVTSEDFDVFERDHNIEKTPLYSKDFAFYVGITRLRANYYYTMRGRAIALRVLPEKIPSPQELRLPEQMVELTALTHGLVIISGSTGSGKTTTSASLINHINNTRRCHIVTIEDPVEYVYTPNLSRISQREVGTQVDSFASAARDAMRQNPNVIFLGEARDVDTVEEASRLAQTDHLVIITTHADNVLGSVDRMCDLFPVDQSEIIRKSIVNSLQCVVHQTLAKTTQGGLVLVPEILRATPVVKSNLVSKPQLSAIREILKTNENQGSLHKVTYLKNLLKSVNIDKSVLKSILSDSDYVMVTNGR